MTGKTTRPIKPLARLAARVAYAAIPSIHLDVIGKVCGRIASQSVRNISKGLWRDGLNVENVIVIWEAFRDESGCMKISDFAKALIDAVAFWALRVDRHRGESLIPVPTLPAVEALKLDEMDPKDAVGVILQSIRRDLYPVLAAINIAAAYAEGDTMRAAARLRIA